MELMTIESSGVFYDNDRFPIGFRRCGEFTIAEAELLHNYGNSLIALESGEKSDDEGRETFCCCLQR